MRGEGEEGKRGKERKRKWERKRKRNRKRCKNKRLGMKDFVLKLGLSWKKGWGLGWGEREE